MDLDFKRIITAFLLCLLIMVGWQYWTVRNAPPAPPASQTATTTGQPAPGTAPATSSAPTTTVPAAPNAAQTAGQIPPSNAPAMSASAATWQLKTLEYTHETAPATVQLGNHLYQQPGAKALITIDGNTAAVASVLLSEHKHKVDDEQTGYPLLTTARDRNAKTIHSLMLGQITLKTGNQQMTFDLSAGCWEIIQPLGYHVDDQATQSVSYAATICDQQQQPALQIIKTYAYSLESYDLDFQLRFVNLSDQPIQVTALEIFGPAGVLPEDPRIDQRAVVLACRKSDGLMKTERQMLTNAERKPEKNLLEKPVATTLQWFALANKYFAAVVRPLPTEQGKPIDYLGLGSVTALPVTIGAGTKEDPEQRSLACKTTFATDQQFAPKSDTAFNLKVYLGAVDKRIFDNDPTYAGLEYTELLYKGGCSFCAFDWITFGLLKVMTFIYAVVHNYGVAIIILVLVVRLLLHPITKKSQVNMMAMSKFGPQIEEIKKKYGDNKQELNRRTMEIYKQQGITPILGCLPMMLQMPIWIGLYTAVNMEVALRHQGLFPASWHWITDLSAPDRLIPFSWFGLAPFTIPMVGTVDALNLLPILLCVAMFLQQKLMPQSAAANPQAAQQQKMMLFMMPAMMLVFLYTGPSGLNLYIMSSTFAGIIESKVIRKHIREQEAIQQAQTIAAPSKISAKFGSKKPKPKPPFKSFR